jgi:hypothetical protein
MQGLHHRLCPGRLLGDVPIYRDVPFSMDRLIMQLIDYVAEMYGVKADDLFKSGHMKLSVTLPRQICMHVIHRYSMATMVDIGAYFNRNHSTVKYSIDTIDNLCDTDKKFKAVMDDIYTKCDELDIPLTASLKVYVNCIVSDEYLLLQ